VEGPPPGGCNSSTTSPSVVYFPAGTYLISSSIKPYYMTQLIGNPNDLPTLKATSGFSSGDGINALIDADPYGSSNPDYGTTNVFYRQVRNFVIDMTSVASGTLVRGIHWPTAQATSLQNLEFLMSTDSATQHQGVFIENGSGGFLTDLVFSGGSPAMNIGSQQFTSRNLTFHNSQTAVLQLWNWGWTYIGLSINNCAIGIDLSALGTVDGVDNALLVGSVTLIDSTIANTPIGVKTSRTSSTSPTSGGSLALENVVLTNVPTAVSDASGNSLAGTAGTMTIAAYVQGNSYSAATNGPANTAGSVTAFPRPASLLSGDDFYTRSKPQYGNLAVSQFSSVRTAGAKGDGVTDDSAAIQSIINSATSAGNVVYFDAGIYKVTTSISIPPGAKIVGEAYPVIMGSGSFFSDQTNPQPVIQVGTTGQSGVIEWSDMIVSTQGATEGAILIQWNLASPATTPSGMWDVHARVGGYTGSNLQVAQCAVGATQPNTNCIAGFQSMHITPSASGVYMENVWLWTADHDIDDPGVTQITVYNGRGLNVESTTGNIWL
jgi:glucan 1,3-beta-glucosidase